MADHPPEVGWLTIPPPCRFSLILQFVSLSIKDICRISMNGWSSQSHTLAKILQTKPEVICGRNLLDGSLRPKAAIGLSLIELPGSKSKRPSERRVT